MKKYDLEFITEETNYGTNRNTIHFFENGLGVSIVTAKDLDALEQQEKQQEKGR